MLIEIVCHKDAHDVFLVEPFKKTVLGTSNSLTVHQSFEEEAVNTDFIAPRASMSVNFVF